MSTFSTGTEPNRRTVVAYDPGFSESHSISPPCFFKPYPLYIRAISGFPARINGRRPPSALAEYGRPHRPPGGDPGRHPAAHRLCGEQGPQPSGAHPRGRRGLAPVQDLHGNVVTVQTQMGQALGNGLVLGLGGEFHIFQHETALLLSSVLRKDYEAAQKEMEIQAAKAKEAEKERRRIAAEKKAAAIAAGKDSSSTGSWRSSVSEAAGPLGS